MKVVVLCTKTIRMEGNGAIAFHIKKHYRGTRDSHTGRYFLEDEISPLHNHEITPDFFVKYFKVIIPFKFGK